MGRKKGQGRGLAYEKCTLVKRGKNGIGVQKEWSWKEKGTRQRLGLRKMYAGKGNKERTRRIKGVELGRKRDKAEVHLRKMHAGEERR